jgi:small conductance mechanosensitive channel
LDVEEYFGWGVNKNMILDNLTQKIIHHIEVSDIVSVIIIISCAWLLGLGVRFLFRKLADAFGGGYRLKILLLIPITRLLIGILALVLIVPIIVTPTIENILALIVGSSLVIGFVFKDFASGAAAGLINILENNYQVGDWVEIDGVYGEVRLINLRSVHMLTADDNEIIIPHNHIWSKKIINSTSGSRSVLCVADFYLDPNHDGFQVISLLKDIARSSIFLKLNSKISVVAKEKPMGTHYKLKAYVKDSRDQFLFISDLTVRAKQSFINRGIEYLKIIPVFAK